MPDEVPFRLNDDHRRWARNAARRYGRGQKYYLDLIEQKEGRCAFSGVPLLFEADNGRAGDGRGCHPLYAALDHTAAGRDDAGHNIVCYALNDIKGHLPLDCFLALESSSAWQEFMAAWRDQAGTDRNDHDAFKALRHRSALHSSSGTPMKMVRLLVPAKLTRTLSSSLQRHVSQVEVNDETIRQALVSNDYHENWYFTDPDLVRILSIEDYPGAP